MFISHSSGGWKSQRKVSAHPVSGEDLLPSPQMTPSAVPSCPGTGRELWAAFHKGTNPSHEGSTLLTPSALQSLASCPHDLRG